MNIFFCVWPIKKNQFWAVEKDYTKKLADDTAKLNTRWIHIFFNFSKVIQQFVWLFTCFVRVVNLKLFLFWFVLLQNNFMIANLTKHVNQDFRALESFGTGGGVGYFYPLELCNSIFSAEFSPKLSSLFLVKAHINRVWFFVQLVKAWKWILRGL